MDFNKQLWAACKFCQLPSSVNCIANLGLGFDEDPRHSCLQIELGGQKFEYQQAKVLSSLSTPNSSWRKYQLYLRERSQRIFVLLAAPTTKECYMPPRHAARMNQKLVRT